MDLEFIPASEYANINGLLGLSDAQVSNALATQPALAKKIISSRNRPIITRGSRADMEARFAQLAPEIKKGLASTAKQLVDSAFYFSQSAGSSTTLRMIRDNDNKVPGLCNVNGGKLERDEPFTLSGIMVLSGVAAGTTEANGVACNFGLIDPLLRNGEFEFKANGKTLIPKMSAEVFTTQRIMTVDVDGAATGANMAIAIGEAVKVGLWKLDNPKLIMSAVGMEFNLEWGAALPANTWVKLILLGTRVAVH
jgi:hypothetical protein